MLLASHRVAALAAAEGMAAVEWRVLERAVALAVGRMAVV